MMGNFFANMCSGKESSGFQSVGVGSCVTDPSVESSHTSLGHEDPPKILVQNTEFVSRESSGFQNGDVDSCVISSNTSLGQEDQNRQHYQDKRKIIKNFRYLKENLEPDEINDHLFQEGIFDNQDNEEITETNYRRKKVDLLLRKILRSTDENAYPKFLWSLHECKMQHIAQMLEKELEEVRIPKTQITEDPKTSLEKVKENWNHYLDTTRVLEQLFELETFSLFEYEDITSYHTEEKKLIKLFQVLEAKLPGSLDKILFIIDGLHKKHQNSPMNSSDSQKIATKKSPSQQEHGRQNSDFVQKGNTTEMDTEKNEMVNLEFKFTLKMRKHHLEEKILHSLESAEIIALVNDNMLQKVECVIQKAEKGSLILRLKPCGPGCFEKLKEICKNGELEGLLKSTILATLDSVQDIDSIELTIEIVPAEFEERTHVRQIKDNIAFLEEELNVSSIVDELFKRGFISNEEVDYILHSEPVLRRHRTQRLLATILKDSDDMENKCSNFIKVVESRQPSINRNMLKSCATQSSTFQICQSYSKLVEKVPSSVLERASGLPQSVEYSQNKCLDEILQRKYKLQQIMKSGESACCHLLTCVEEEGYLEHEDINEEFAGNTSEKSREMQKNCNTVTEMQKKSTLLFKGKLTRPNTSAVATSKPTLMNRNRVNFVAGDQKRSTKPGIHNHVTKSAMEKRVKKAWDMCFNQFGQSPPSVEQMNA